MVPADVNELLYIRLAEAIAEAPEESRARLSRAAGGATDPEQIARSLAQPRRLVERLRKLEPRVESLLTELLGGRSLDLAIDDPDSQALLKTALAFRAPTGQLYCPIDVRVGLAHPDSLSDADSGPWLARLDEESLLDLAQRHDVEVPEGSEQLTLVVAIMRALHDHERLGEILETLQPAARRLLYWVVGAGEPVRLRSFELRAREIAARTSEKAATVQRVLERLGLLHVVSQRDGDWVVVPHDIAAALEPGLDERLGMRCEATFRALRDQAAPAFRDVFARGEGGDPRRVARELLVRCVAGEVDAAHPLSRVLHDLRIIDLVAGDAGELASVHLDASGADLFAQQCLRTWLWYDDDSFTHRLIAAFGGDSLQISAHLAEAVESQGDAADRASDREIWISFLNQFRAHILLVLGILPAGYWFRVESLAPWLCAVYRRTLWLHGGFADLSESFVRDALPMDGVDVGPQTEADARRAIRDLLTGLLQPIGAVELHASEPLFVVNGEALRAFSDGDLDWEELVSGSANYLGSEVDHSLPTPVDPGPSFAETNAWSWNERAELEAGSSVWTADLVRVASWAEPRVWGGRLSFRFSEQSVDEASEDGGDGDQQQEMYLWLATRVRGEVPSRVKSAFSSVGALVASEAAVLQAQARAQVEMLLDRLESWGDQPPLSLMEEIRGWGEVAVQSVCERAELLISEQGSQPTLPLLLVLLGEIRSASGAPTVLRALGLGPSDRTDAPAAMAAARLGRVALPSLVALAENETAVFEKRMAALSALASTAVILPTTADRVAEVLLRFSQDEEMEPEVATTVAMLLAETGHSSAEAFVDRLQAMNVWSSDVASADDVRATAGYSPCLWGHPLWALPLAQLFPCRSESERLAREAGVDDIVRESGGTSDAMHGTTEQQASRRRRRDPT
jgi:hypothetical protein